MYTCREVSELVGLTMTQVRRFARAGYLSPERTPRNHYRFSFQDLIFLRTTTALLATDLPRQRVHRALRELRRQQPLERPLSEVQLTPHREGIVACDGGAVWEAESGQVLVDFAAGHHATPVSPIRPDAADGAAQALGEPDTEVWFERGRTLEASQPTEARQAYRRALALNPTHPGARVNLARLLHGVGQIADAVEHYRIVLATTPEHSTAAFNLGVAFEDLGRPQEAFAAYAQALAADPDCAEAHFNIAKLYEAVGDELAELRHLRTYRELVRGGGS